MAPIIFRYQVYVYLKIHTDDKFMNCIKSSQFKGSGKHRRKKVHERQKLQTNMNNFKNYSNTTSYMLLLLKSLLNLIVNTESI